MLHKISFLYFIPINKFRWNRDFYFWAKILFMEVSGETNFKNGLGVFLVGMVICGGGEEF